MIINIPQKLPVTKKQKFYNRTMEISEKTSDINNQVDIKQEPIEAYQLTGDDDEMYLNSADALSDEIKYEYHLEEIQNDNFSRIKCEELDIKQEPDFDVENLDDNIHNKSQVQPSENNCLSSSTSYLTRETYSTWFCCIYCTFTTIRTPHLDLHAVVHDVKSTIIVCRLCDDTFKTIFCLEQHLLSNHNNEICISDIINKIYQCSQCSYQTLSIGQFKLHLIQHKISVDCKHCGYLSMNNCTFIRICKNHFHMKLQMDAYILLHYSDDKNQMATITNRVYACASPKCSFKSVSNNDFRQHFKMCNPSIRSDNNYYCKIWETRFNHYSNNEKLMETGLTGTSRIHKCPKCSYTSASAPILKRHMTMRHTDKGTITKTEKKNVLSITKTPIFQCKICAYNSFLLTNVKKHLISTHVQQPPSNPGPIKHRGAVYECTLCSKYFHKKLQIDSHIFLHHSDNETLMASITTKIHECPNAALNHFMLRI